MTEADREQIVGFTRSWLAARLPQAARRLVRMSQKITPTVKSQSEKGRAFSRPIKLGIDPIAYQATRDVVQLTMGKPTERVAVMADYRLEITESREQEEAGECEVVDLGEPVAPPEVHAQAAAEALALMGTIEALDATDPPLDLGPPEVTPA